MIEYILELLDGAIDRKAPRQIISWDLSCILQRPSIEKIKNAEFVTASFSW